MYLRALACVCECEREYKRVYKPFICLRVCLLPKRVCVCSTNAVCKILHSIHRFCGCMR